MNAEELDELLLHRSTEGRIPCAAALTLAAELNMPSAAVGEALDRLGIRIVACQLGCFE